MDGHNPTPSVPTYAGLFAAPGFGPPITPVLGVIHVLVLAVDFQDTSAKMSIAELKQQWFGTVPAYYHEASYGKLTIQGDIYGWYQLPHPQSYYGKNCHAINDADCSGTNQSWKIANDTVALAEKSINFSQYDYFVFLHSGTGQETSLKNDDIWSVTYLNASIPTPTTTLTRFSIVPELEAPPNVPNGVWCVEFAHDLGVPDLYDTRNGPNHGKSILGPWELMDKGSWNGDPPGSLPAHMTAWAKIQLGWINGSMLTTVTAGTSTIAVYPTEVASYQVHAIRIPISATQNSTQYYLVEVRKQIGFDAALPTSGVLITFVNETQSFGVVSVINSDPAVADLADAVWHLDQTFSDNAHKLTIDVTGETATYYDVSVTLGSNTLPTPRLTSTNSTNSTEKISINGVPLTVELATTLPAQERGLSGLPSLPKNEGMLFIFDHEDYWAFWMIDMQFPLDIIWFNSAHEVVWTEPNLQPCPPSNCPVIMPSVKSMYVLEVNAGFVAANHIRLGMRFYFT
jgi:M6 family metalloprotease-like protein